MQWISSVFQYVSVIRTNYAGTCVYAGTSVEELMPCPPNLPCSLITVSFKLFFLILFYHCCALNLPDIFSWSLGFMSFLLVFLTSLLVFLAFDVSSFFQHALFTHCGLFQVCIPAFKGLHHTIAGWSHSRFSVSYHL